MPSTKTPTRFALTLLAATCLTPIGPATAAPGDRLGPEFQVNSFTTGDQAAPAIAMDPDGDFVVAWSGCPVDSYSYNIWDLCDVFAQRYDAAGRPQGAEFRVNTTTANYQGGAAVALAPDGDFVVVWSGYGPGDNSGIFAQRYNVAGDPQGGEFRVNTTTVDSQFVPSVAMDADGDFVVAWKGQRVVSSRIHYDVVAQRYDAAGLPQGDEFQVGTTNSVGFFPPSVARAAEGQFVVAWGNASSAFVRRYDASGVPQGDELQVPESRFPGAVAMDSDGDFVVVWGTSIVLGQRYSAAGDPTGGQFTITTLRKVMGHQPDVAMDADGDFAVVWFGYGPGDSYGAVARRYSAAGEPQGGEFQVNTFTTGGQFTPTVAMDADGDFVVAWTDSYGQDGDGTGIFAQRFDGAERVAGDFDGDGKADLLWRNTATGQTSVWLMDGETRLAGRSIGTPTLAWQIAGTGDFNGDGKSDVLWRNSETGNTVVWQMDGLELADARSIGAPPLAWTVEQLRDTSGDGLSDIVWRNSETGATVVWRMSGFTMTAAEPIGKVGSDWELH